MLLLLVSKRKAKPCNICQRYWNKNCRAYIMNILTHLHGRRLDTHLHRVWIDEANRLATFPLWNLSGQLVGYQQYRPHASKEAKNDPREGRYFTRLKENKVGVWGLESFNLSPTLFICEGIFDAARISAIGYAALATLSNDIAKPTASWLRVIRSSRRVVAICDSDTSGRRLSKHASTSHVVSGYKDLGEAPESYVQNIVKEYSK